MQIGIGLPSTIPGASGRQIVDWARSADGRGFSTLGTIDRLAYPNYEPLAALAAAAAVTERIRLMTSILLAPLRANHTAFAKQAASVNALSDGRLVLGLAVGGREDDYTESGLPFDRRGADFDALLARATEVWNQADDDERFIPRGAAPEIVLGGHSDATFRRMVRYGSGWIAGGGGPDMFRGGADRARQAWTEAGRDGQPKLQALAYYALGPDADAAARRYLMHYYRFLGPITEQIAAGALTSPEQVQDAVSAFADAGCDELILFPCDPDPGQVDQLADATGVGG